MRALQILRAVEDLSLGERDHGERARLIDRNERHRGDALLARNGEGGQISKTEIGAAGSHQAKGIGGAGPSPDSSDLDVLLFEVAFLIGEEDHRVTAAYHPVQLNGDTIGGMRTGAEKAKQNCNESEVRNFRSSLFDRDAKGLAQLFCQRRPEWI